MAIHSVLKIPQAEPSSFVLVQVKSVGSKPLDVKLLGTEGENPYAGKLNHDHAASLKVSNSPVSDAEWQSILESLFQQRPIENIQATATVQSETSISITIRKEVQGITQRLGTITLKHDAKAAIELFDWCATASEAATASNAAVVEASSRISQLEASVSHLKGQLDELIHTKEIDKKAQLQKFCDLLNEKKVKIREQQKIIAAGSFNHPNKPSQDEAEEDVQPKRKPTTSRPGKRKANKKTATPESDDEADEMQVELPEPVVKTEPQDSDDGETTDRTASADESEDDDEQDDGNATERNPTPQETTTEAKKKSTQQPPPRRDLPFLNKQPAKQTPAAEDTDSDDEL